MKSTITAIDVLCQIQETYSTSLSPQMLRQIEWVVAAHEATIQPEMPLSMDQFGGRDSFAARMHSTSHAQLYANYLAAKQQRDKLLAVCEELSECAEYWSEYDVPIGIVARLDAAIAEVKGQP